MQLSPPSSKEEVQAILDLVVVRDVPLRYEGGLFKMNKIDSSFRAQVGVSWDTEVIGTQYIETVLRWMDEYDKFGRKGKLP